MILYLACFLYFIVCIFLASWPRTLLISLFMDIKIILLLADPRNNNTKGILQDVQSLVAYVSWQGCLVV